MHLRLKRCPGRGIAEMYHAFVSGGGGTKTRARVGDFQEMSCTSRVLLSIAMLLNAGTVAECETESRYPPHTTRRTGTRRGKCVG